MISLCFINVLNGDITKMEDNDPDLTQTKVSKYLRSRPDVVGVGENPRLQPKKWIKEDLWQLEIIIELDVIIFQ